MKSLYYKEILSDIPETTTIHGILQIAKTSEKCCKGIWLLMFFVSLSVCIYGCRQNIQEYLKLDIQTSQKFQRISNITIPEIFFCSPNSLKRSQVGNWSMAPMFLTQMLGRGQEYQAELFRMNSETCKSNTTSAFIDLVNIMGANELFRNPQLTKEYLFHQAWTTYESDVVGCWWNEKPLDRHKFFVNKFADDQMCFSFNAGTEIVKFLQQSRNIESNSSSNYVESVLTTNNAYSSSVTILLNINQSEYCGTDYIKRGAGYSVYLNKHGGTLFTTLKQPVNLEPGYSHNIFMKPLQFEKHTEHLGHCSSKFHNNNIFKSSFTYAQSFCIFQQLLVFMIRECQCLPGNFIDFIDLLKKSTDLLDVPPENVRICDPTQGGSVYLCARNIQMKYLIQQSVNDVFLACKPECSKADFKTQVTSTLLPMRHLKNYLSNKRIDVKDDKQLEKNFMYVTFEFESNYIERFDEYQAITLKDLFASLGNNIGLFLGMSFMSSFEILIQIILRSLVLVIKYLKHFGDRKSNRLVPFNKGNENRLVKRRRKSCSVHESVL